MRVNEQLVEYWYDWLPSRAACSAARPSERGRVLADLIVATLTGLVAMKHVSEDDVVVAALANLEHLIETFRRPQELPC